MSDLIAKRYAKAISGRLDLGEFSENLDLISSAFSSEKFRLFLESFEFKREKKVEVILSFVENVKPEFRAFVEILAQNSRLGLIPKIKDELDKQKALRDNIFFGEIFSRSPLKEDQIVQIETKLSDKFKTTIKLKEKESKVDGVRISLDELGYEISFSMSNLKMKMCEYILKAI